MAYKCECIKCGHKETSEQHCAELKCSECGGQMRRAERPGPGQESADMQEAATKTDGGQRFPAAAYAYVPDPEKSSTWKLRLWETPEKKITRAQLGRATAAFSPGGFRGQRVELPSGDIAKVKAKIRAAYRQLGVKTDEIPQWVRETDNTRRFVSVVTHPLEEGAFNEAAGVVTLTVIKPGFNVQKSRFYPPAVLKRDCKVFEGVKMFANHATQREQMERPEGSVDDWVAQIKRVWPEQDGTIKAEAAVIDEKFKGKLAELNKHGLLNEMGASIRAIARSTKGRMEGVKTNIVQEFFSGRSVDFVTYPGAGGQVEVLEAAEMPETDVDIIDEEELRARRPDLVEIIESAIRADNPAEEARAMADEQVEKLNEQLAAAEKLLSETMKERDELNGKLEEAQRVEARGIAQQKIAEIVSKATSLPEPAKERLTQQFAEAETTDGVAEAIEKEEQYIATLAKAGVVKNMGDGGQETTEADEGHNELVKTLTESYRRKGFREEDAVRRAKAMAG